VDLPSNLHFRLHFGVEGFFGLEEVCVKPDYSYVILVTLARR
jgi:hypothetical protein